ncbi:MAG TPA: ADP-ribosylglycohydrolase family protein [Phycisphaerae bacterium]|nr:ADP-ribosylglycohydrolase family protein [Phycisphaerae bacterium]HRY70607.1 ADP-ribosylglycohydrolase family protein [Phycisphaerae bacterium]HSA28343.1 ADP-ribosylglycohydrolase family protein [Phycisphaerae bacterium]
MKRRNVIAGSAKMLTGLACLSVALVTASPARGVEYRRLSVKEYRDKMKGGWIGQIAGVCWGAPTEFKFTDKIIPEEAMPKWTPDMINNAFGQDDLYVEMTFLRSMEQYGLDVSIRQAGIDFANSKYPLWCANNAGRNNLRDGIAPPDCSHPKFNRCPNDIDYQIEADFSGLIAPGMPNAAIELGEKFGRLMNYGDGVYGGQFMGGMYTEAFFESDPVKLVKAGLKCIPSKSQYAEMVRDMLRWYAENPTDWQKTWQLAQKKYREDPAYQKASNGGIDVKINGAYVLMGLLYGKRDLDQTIIISCRSGQDSDCNPSSSAGVLFATIGFSKLPDRFTKELSETKVFSHTAYNFPALLNVCEKLARQVLVGQGGRIEKNAAGEDEFVIPAAEVRPSPLELSWEPGPIADSRFTEEEMARITEWGPKREFEKYFPGWSVRDCGKEMDPGLKNEYAGRKHVYVTHPLSRETGCTLSRTIDVPAGKQTVLRLVVGHHPEGDWTLIVKADGKPLLEKSIGKDISEKGWASLSVDLSDFAGKTVKLELVNQPSGWFCEAAYWGEVVVESK